MLTNHQKELVRKATKVQDPVMLQRIETLLLNSNNSLNNRSGAEFMKLAQLALKTLQMQNDAHMAL